MRPQLRSHRVFQSAFILVLLVLLIAVEGVAAQGPLDLFNEACNDGSNNPYLATTCFRLGFKGEDASAIVAYRDTPNNSGHVTLATAAQVGSVYGLSYNARTETLYAAAFHKRGVHHGPAGPGGIYALDLRNGTISTFGTVPNAGGDQHDASGDYFPDTPARFAAGRTSLGDLDLKGDASELAVVNLNDRKIYRFAVPGGSALGSFDHGAAGEPWAADARPFGVDYHDGRMYHGVVRTAESSQNRDELSAYVYESAPDGSGMREVASTGLIYERGNYWPGEGNAVWNPWIDPPGDVHDRYGRYAMPLLSDIEFTHANDQMILGFRDRFGDTTFYTQRPQVPPPGEKFNNVPAGDILPAYPDGDRWRIQVDPEFYTGDFGSRPTGQHDETSFGGLAMIPNVDTVSMSANSPVRANSAGGVWLSTSGGSDTAREEIYAFNEGDNLGKANGLGDVEVICDTMDEPTPTPQDTDTPVPTPTPVQSDTPSPTSTPQPTATATATVVPSPTSTLPPGVTPTATVPPTITPTAPPTIPSTDTPDDTPVAPPPPSTPELPDLPRTGGGGVDGGTPGQWASAVMAAIALVAVLVMLAVSLRRQSRTTAGSHTE